jgi:hypothetical protein
VACGTEYGVDPHVYAVNRIEQSGKVSQVVIPVELDDHLL